MSFGSIKIQYSYHLSRIIHGVVTIFHPFRPRESGSHNHQTGFDQHVQNVQPVGNNQSTSLVMDPIDLCIENFFVPELDANNSADAIEKLCKVLKKHPGMIDHEKFCSDVMKRENLKSTGIGHHLAIPHARSEGVKQIMMAVGKSGDGIDFQSPDGDLTHYVVLIGTPMDQVKGYLKLLASIARMFKTESIREELFQAEGCKDMVKIFQKYLEGKKIS